MIRPLTESELAAVEPLVDEVLGSRWQARLGELVDVLALPGFVGFAAWDEDEDEDRPVGFVTASVDGPTAEIVAVGVAGAHRGRGLAGRLIEAAVAEVAGRSVRRVWIVTTNDNLVALAAYQRHGFRLAELHPGSVDRARALKPAIPEVGPSGIPMHDEIVLERRLP